jgi:bifunctional non-homologous end joining protein LigD
MALKDYQQKRKFDETSEPKGKTKKSKNKLIFVIQRHAATSFIMISDWKWKVY